MTRPDTLAHGRSAPLSGWRVLGVTLIVGAVVVAFLVAWRLSEVLLLGFASVLTAVLLRALADLIARHTPLEAKPALAAAAALVGLAALAFLGLVGAQIRIQFATLLESLPEVIATLEDITGISGLRGWLETRAEMPEGGGEMIGSLAGASGAVLSGLARIVLVLFAGLYLAVDPGLYRRGLLALLPPAHRGTAGDTLDAVGRALRLWLLGQLFAMALVGVVTTLGLWLIGVPSALALGFLAALLEFVPIAGPALAAVPAVALGLSESLTTGALVLGLYVVIQQVEGNLITPLVHKRAVDLPPVVTIFAIMAFGVLFGPLGILLSTPLAVTARVLLGRLWIEEALGEKARLPGDGERADSAG